MPTQLFCAPHLPHLEGKSASVCSERDLLPTVQGLRWGEFVGSPEIDDRLFSSPSVVINLDFNQKIHHLVAIYKEGGGTCWGVPESTELIAKYKTDRNDILRRSFELEILAAISWNFHDGLLRIQHVQHDETLWVNLLDLQNLEISKVAFSPSNDLLYVGFKTGLIRVYSLSYKSAARNWSIHLFSELIAHRLDYVRTLVPPPSSSEEITTLSCVSTVSCDVAVVFQSGYGSRVVLFTANGDVVGVYEDQQTITSIAMTDLDEGTGINCIALGLQSGCVRLLETWTLSVVRNIAHLGYEDPVISLQFTNESRRLYAALANSHVLCWQVPSLSTSKSRQPSFRMLNPFH
ncbi:beige/BEACH domain-containing protein [Aphelenchoides avenae]|nr:beige/BEACH domain-containing protein [Aphelenchus avenae]